MTWEAGPYTHPQGARLARVVLTAKAPVSGDHVATVYWREHELGDETSIATVTIKSGQRIGMKPLGGQVMHPMDSLVRVASEATAPDGLVVTVGFNR